MEKTWSMSVLIIGLKTLVTQEYAQLFEYMLFRTHFLRNPEEEI